jgi:hypothetical protein
LQQSEAGGHPGCPQTTESTHMEKIRMGNELLENARQDNTDAELLSDKSGNEIRTLSELELMVTSGGDAIVCW